MSGKLPRTLATIIKLFHVYTENHMYLMSNQIYGFIYLAHKKVLYIYFDVWLINGYPLNVELGEKRGEGNAGQK